MKIDENSSYWQRMSSYFLNDLRNFSEISGMIWLMIILKGIKNQGLTLSLEDKFLEKPQGLTKTPPAFLGLNKAFLLVSYSDEQWI